MSFLVNLSSAQWVNGARFGSTASMIRVFLQIVHCRYDDVSSCDSDAMSGSHKRGGGRGHSTMVFLFVR